MFFLLSYLTLLSDSPMTDSSQSVGETADCTSVMTSVGLYRYRCSVGPKKSEESPAGLESALPACGCWELHFPPVTSLEFGHPGSYLGSPVRLLLDTSDLRWL